MKLKPYKLYKLKVGTLLIATKPWQKKRIGTIVQIWDHHYATVFWQDNTMIRYPISSLFDFWEICE